MFFGFAPSSKRINADIGRIRKKAHVWLAQLVPWSVEDLELFSFNQKGKVSKKRFGWSYEGIICSIFHESMVFYHLKKYPVSKTNAILYVRTARYEIVYRIKVKETQVFINNNYFGSLTPQGILYNKTAKNGILGRVSESGKFRKTITINTREAGSVIFPEYQATVNPRAFEVDVRLSDTDLICFMVLGIYEVVWFLLPRNKMSGKGSWWKVFLS